MTSMTSKWRHYEDVTGLKLVENDFFFEVKLKVRKSQGVSTPYLSLTRSGKLNIAAEGTFDPPVEVGLKEILHIEKYLPGGNTQYWQEKRVPSQKNG